MFSPPVASHLLLRAIPRRLAPQRTNSIHLGPSRAREVPSSASGGSRAADIRAPVVRSPGGGSPKVDSSLRLSTVCSPPARGHQTPPPEQEADSPPAGAPTCRSDPHHSFGVGPYPGPAPGAAHRPDPGPRPQLGSDPRRPRPAPGRTSPPEAAPGAAAALKPPRSRGPSPAALQHRDPSGTARPGPARRPGRGLSAAPGSPSHSGARSRGGRDRTSAVPPSTAVVPLHSGHRTARISASRHRFKVGPSGADQLSVRHARLRGHAPETVSMLTNAEFGEVGECMMEQ
ncbi:hypothetical protein NDU88_008535 [Pleurodeles waltl]|uniref:Uncharacterized protein n=1 Tax=Pleurodeles waltl TaxID=8319 RepID=A0AAV7P5C9_PLEWA|nr:hypothetical protein NDU88_008535 [Pleurodeles waltl]